MENKTLEKLNKTLKDIEKSLKKQTTLKFNFLRGIAYGFGLVLGTTILVSIILSITGIFIDFVPFINSLFGFDPEALKEALNTPTMETVE